MSFDHGNIVIAGLMFARWLLVVGVVVPWAAGVCVVTARGVWGKIGGGRGFRVRAYIPHRKNKSII